MVSDAEPAASADAVGFAAVAAEPQAVGRREVAMGVTIHFEGRLLDRECLTKAMDVANAFAKKQGWPAESISAAERKLARVRDEQNWDYVGPVEGVAFYPAEDCEPVRLEFDRDLYLQEYTKTQFAGPAVHVSVVELLRTLEPFFVSLRVEDEGEYWETNRLELLERHLTRCDNVLQEIVASRPGVQAKVKLPSGRIIDYMT